MTTKEKKNKKKEKKQNQEAKPTRSRTKQHLRLLQVENELFTIATLYVVLYIISRKAKR